MSVTIALDALSKDAARWDEVSEALGGAAHSAGGLRLDDSAFSFAGGAAASTYESVRSRVESLLRGGESETSGAADALLEVKRAYEGMDRAAAAALNGAWDAD